MPCLSQAHITVFDSKCSKMLYEGINTITRQVCLHPHVLSPTFCLNLNSKQVRKGCKSNDFILL